MGIGSHSISERCKLLIRELVDEGSILLELGSGNTTQELKKYFKVYSIEHDSNWIPKWWDKSEGANDYIYAPIKDGWYDVEKIKDKLPEKYDAILIDGPPGNTPAGGRMGFYNNIELFTLINDIPIIIDDVHRDQELELIKLLSEYLNKPYVILDDDPGTGYIV
jgi:hypothetical protein